MLILALLLSIAAAASPGTVTLAWDPNSETDLAGYKVYWGTAPGTYSNTPPTVAVSPMPTYTVAGLSPGVKYYFAVTAFNADGLESGYSNEVSATIPAPPTGLSITSQSASLRWFGVVLLATTNEPAKAVLRYRLLGETQYQTVVATPDPIRTEHRAILYDLPKPAHYAYEWTVTSAGGVEAKGAGTFETR